jgi:hypothetical protein
MPDRGLPRTVEEQGPPPPERRPETCDRWYRFLEDECQKDNGLLCFYDRHKSWDVAYFCGLLAHSLMFAGNRGSAENLAKFLDIGTRSEQGEDSYASLRNVGKVRTR